jgi:hypothetical protein
MFVVTSSLFYKESFVLKKLVKGIVTIADEFSTHFAPADRTIAICTIAVETEIE